MPTRKEAEFTETLTNGWKTESASGEAARRLTLALVRLLPDRRRRAGCGVCNVYDGSGSRQGCVSMNCQSKACCSCCGLETAASCCAASSGPPWPPTGCGGPGTSYTCRKSPCGFCKSECCRWGSAAGSSCSWSEPGRSGTPRCCSATTWRGRWSWA